MHYIYIVGSLQQSEKIKNFATKLRNDKRFKNYKIFDDWTSHGSNVDIEFYKYAKERNLTYSEALKNPVAQSVFKLDRHLINMSNIVIMIQPCGKSAALELGYAAGKGKMTIIIRDSIEYEKVEIMENFADMMFDSEEDFFSRFWPNEDKPQHMEF